MKKQSASNVSSFLTGRTPLIVCTFVLCLILVSGLTSCQTGVYRDTDAYLKKVPSWMLTQCPGQTAQTTQTYYGPRTQVYQQPPRVMYYALPPKVSQKSESSARSRLISSSKPSVSSNVSFNGSPPTGLSHRYNAWWDRRPTLGSPNGYYLVTNQVGRHWKLSPERFYPFWSGHIYKGGRITTFPLRY